MLTQMKPSIGLFDFNIQQRRTNNDISTLQRITYYSLKKTTAMFCE